MHRSVTSWSATDSQGGGGGFAEVQCSQTTVLWRISLTMKPWLFISHWTVQNKSSIPPPPTTTPHCASDSQASHYIPGKSVKWNPPVDWWISYVFPAGGIRDKGINGFCVPGGGLTVLGGSAVVERGGDVWGGGRGGSSWTYEKVKSYRRERREARKERVWLWRGNLAKHPNPVDWCNIQIPYSTVTDDLSTSFIYI